MTSVNLTNYSGKARTVVSLRYASIHPHLCRRDLSAGDFFFFFFSPPPVELTRALRALLAGMAHYLPGSTAKPVQQ